MSCAPAIRVGDGMKIICELGCLKCPHSARGVVLEGSDTVFINGIGASRLGDGGACLCVHNGQFKITLGSSTVFINGQAAIRTKDEATCEMCGEVGYLLNGSDTVFIGD